MPKIYVVKQNEYLALIAKKHKISLNQLLSANPAYKANPDDIDIGDQIVIPDAAAGKTPPKKKVPRSAANRRRVAASEAQNFFKVPAGQLTFDAEGLETPGKFFSRKPHVPGQWSGVTIGRGYDMRERSEAEILEDLNAAGVSAAKAKKFAKCRGLSGNKAKKFLEENGYTELTITPEQQWKLFNSVYAELAGDVIRICKKPDVVAKYGETQWNHLDSVIKDIVVDLRYRGDYTGATRERVQPVLVSNDRDGLADLMADKNYWVSGRGVPNDRYKRRRDYLDA